LPLASLSVIADAVSTPFQAIRRSGIGRGDLAVFVGCGGVGGFGVQIAAALGAVVVALDADSARLAAMERHGAALTLNPVEHDFRQIKSAVQGLAAERGIPSFRHFVFETSGVPAGQSTAWGLLGPGSYLSVVGFTAAKIEIRLANLMAFDATVQGNWACLPELYPEVLELVLDGRVAIAPFVEHRPLADINETFAELHAGPLARRVVLVPETRP
jgi:6-hydroxycyclohex-1-ene-1-carbonyl-CoA dehydrogenase